MTPRKFLAWAFATAIALLLWVGSVLALSDFYLGKFPRFSALASVSTPLGQALIIAGLAAGVATALVLILAASRGPLEISAMGISLKGPAGPLLLWTVVFLCIATAFVVILTAISPGRTTSGVGRSGVDHLYSQVMSFKTGWIFVGYYADEQGFVEGPDATVVLRPGSGERGAIVPKIGDILQARKPRRVIIAGYQTYGLKNQMTSPSLIKGSILADDETGVVIEPNALLLVRDVVLSHYSARPYAVWCRVVECDRPTDSCRKAVAELDGD